MSGTWCEVRRDGMGFSGVRLGEVRGEPAWYAAGCWRGRTGTAAAPAGGAARVIGAVPAPGSAAGAAAAAAGARAAGPSPAGAVVQAPQAYCLLSRSANPDPKHRNTD